jgi:GDP-4-dehydro-6-deoxy-D-mannose reductase
MVTGANGFVGKHLIACLSLALPKSIVFSPEFDLSDEEKVTEAIRVFAPDSCVHLAAVSTIAMAREDQTRAWAVNLHVPLRLAEAILRHAPKCQLIFASTTDAYGASFRRFPNLDESAPLAPLNLYAATKAAADLALGAMVSRGLRLVRARPVNHTGPGQKPDFVVPAFAQQIVRIAAGLQKPILQVGNISVFRDFLDVRDVCAAYISCIMQREALAPGEIFNLASGTPRRLADVLDAMKTLSGVTADVEIDPARSRPSDVPITSACAGHAHNVLGWAPVTPWTQTLQEVLVYWKERIANDVGKAGGQ